MGTVRRSLSLDDDRDADLIAFLDQHHGDGSAILREALREHIAGHEDDTLLTIDEKVSETLRRVRNIENRLDSGDVRPTSPPTEPLKSAQDEDTVIAKNLDEGLSKFR
jgi:hypothetical protein